MTTAASCSYVRVEFAGIEFSPDNELNGIAFQAVGRGTQVDHVQSHLSRDDALEWFGGTVDGKYLVMSGAADDGLDWTFGWSGRVQFAAILQRGDDADNAIEADNNEFSNNVVPRSHPQIYNVTICGDPDWDRVGGSAGREPASRHGVHDPQLPDHGDAAGLPDRNDEHGDDWSSRQWHVADGCGSVLEQSERPGCRHAPVRRCTRASPLT